jgi:hypothetical protein
MSPLADTRDPFIQLRNGETSAKQSGLTFAPVTDKETTHVGE